MADLPLPTNPATAERSAPTVRFLLGRNWILFILTAGATLAAVDRHILSILLGQIQDEFRLSDTQLGILSGPAFGIMYAVMALPLAIAADRISRRGVLTFSYVAFSALTFAFGAAGSFAQLVAIRMGVAVGEAGTSPASQATIADLYPPAELTKAISIFYMSATIGSLLAALAGGFLSALFGWRATFEVLGIVGIILAPIIYFGMGTVTRRVAQEKKEVAAPRHGPPLLESLRFFWSQRAYRNLVAGYAIWTFTSAGILVWVPIFILRIHGPDQATMGVMLAVLKGAGGAVGVIVIGHIAQKMGRRDNRWTLWVVCIALAASLPCIWVAVLSGSAMVALVAGIVTAFLTLSSSGPVHSLIQQLIPRPMRSTAVATKHLIATAGGGAIGPLVIGIASDLLNERYGVASLQYVFLAMSTLWLLTSAMFVRAAMTLREDIVRAQAWVGNAAAAERQAGA